MKISINWLKELVDLKVSMEEVVRLLPLRTIGTKEITEDFIELDMKGYNRADLLSLRGIAYEITAITDSQVTFEEPNPENFSWSGKNLIEALVKVENTELAPLYCIAKISGLKTEASPKEWVKKLADSGIRSVNNIADITNLVMLEYGQPSHAFDAATVKDQKLIVRTAKEGETLVTLDNKVRKLQLSDLLITDPEKAVGLAGVMGGKNSEVTETTSEILLEVAIFEPKTIRKTAGRLTLPSEASRRFQHGLTKIRALQALDALIRMYQESGGKLEAISIIDNLEETEKTITLTQQKVNSLIGVEIEPEDVENYLRRLHFTLSSQVDAWEATRPYFRLDTNIEEDIIEEVARMYGYEKIPPQELRGKLPEKIDQALFDLLYNLKLRLVELGLTEIQTYSFYSSKIINELRLTTNDLIKIANPISSETEYLRDEIWLNLLEKSAENLKYFKEVTVFEIGKAYQAKPELQEEYRLSMLLSDDSGDPTPELYQIFQSAGQHLEGVHQVTADPHLPGEQREYCHPTRYAALEKDGEQIGFI
ncbi:MAG: phenylalanine--tRNA ligase subunit beta, partial [Candidatus Daviesbacteria bacterium]|nr:phenylalanine--tRNA ligase subunit beta [Candidatus Daviesbacteria bacterium]